MHVGRTLGGRYEILELIASGGMGEVYRARDRELDELVALKVIRTDRADEAMVERFRHEVKLARRVTHANVARTFELGRAGQLVFYTMELVDGETLEQRLTRQRRLSVAEAVGIACAVCDALIAAHGAHVIHRDIKPSNVLIASDGRVVLADFGIAAAASIETDTSGTPGYMAPEQARGEPATPATDVYAVGVVLYEMLSGQRAFAGSPLEIAEARQTCERLVPSGGEISNELAEVVARATAASTAERFASASALQKALAPWATADMVASQPPRRAPSNVASVEQRTVIVIAPSAQKLGELDVASEVHEQLLDALSRSSLRVIARTEQTLSPARLVVRFTADDRLRVQVSPDDAPAFALSLPLEPEHVPRSVGLVSAAIHVAAGAKPVEMDPATELLHRARRIARGGAQNTAEAMSVLGEALRHSPDDPRVHAYLAMALARRSFFVGDDGSGLRLAGDHVRKALELGRDLADAHLAAGHFELHGGDPAIAAGHFRVAIACAPFLAEAHEHLGRMLIEAGYLDAAIARFEEATAISPLYVSVQWELARAMALENRWDEHARYLDQTVVRGRNLAVARFAWWRGDREEIRRIRDEEDGSLFEPVLVRMLLDTIVDRSWAERRDALMVMGLEDRSPSRRRRVFIAQLLAEVSGDAGATEDSNRLLEHAADVGLFDLHWLDRAPTLRAARDTPAFGKIRARIEARARSIYDALYGDHGIGPTLPATS